MVIKRNQTTVRSGRTALCCSRCNRGHAVEDCTREPCYECGEYTHNARDCPRLKCKSCGYEGHSYKNCPDFIANVEVRCGCDRRELYRQSRPNAEYYQQHCCRCKIICSGTHLDIGTHGYGRFFCKNCTNDRSDKGKKRANTPPRCQTPNKIIKLEDRQPSKKVLQDTTNKGERDNSQYPPPAKSDKSIFLDKEIIKNPIEELIHWNYTDSTTIATNQSTPTVEEFDRNIEQWEKEREKEQKEKQIKLEEKKRLLKDRCTCKPYQKKAKLGEPRGSGAKHWYDQDTRLVGKDDCPYHNAEKCICYNKKATYCGYHDHEIRLASFYIHDWKETRTTHCLNCGRKESAIHSHVTRHFVAGQHPDIPCYDPYGSCIHNYCKINRTYYDHSTCPQCEVSVRGIELERDRTAWKVAQKIILEKADEYTMKKWQNQPEVTNATNQQVQVVVTQKNNKSHLEFINENEYDIKNNDITRKITTLPKENITIRLNDIIESCAKVNLNEKKDRKINLSLKPSVMNKPWYEQNSEEAKILKYQIEKGYEPKFNRAMEHFGKLQKKIRSLQEENDQLINLNTHLGGVIQELNNQIINGNATLMEQVMYNEEAFKEINRLNTKLNEYEQEGIKIAQELEIDTKMVDSTPLIALDNIEESKENSSLFNTDDRLDWDEWIQQFIQFD